MDLTLLQALRPCNLAHIIQVVPQELLVVLEAGIAVTVVLQDRIDYLALRLVLIAKHIQPRRLSLFFFVGEVILRMLLSLLILQILLLFLQIH